MENKRKMNKPSAIAYSAGFASTNIIWYMINNYLMLFYTDVVGLAAGAISMIMLIARIWDAINDPMMGVIVDRTNSRWGRFRPYIAIAPPVLAIFNILTFTVFPLEGTAKVVVCLLTYIGAGMAYTVVSVAINGLLNRLSDDSQIKMNIVSMSQVASSVVGVILSACAMPLILMFSHSDVATGAGYFKATVIFSIISVPLLWFCAWKCREEVHDAPVDSTAGKTEKRPIKESFKLLLKNKNILIAIFMVFAGATAAIARMSFLSYYIIYVAGSFTLIAPVFTTITIMQTLGNMTLPFFTKKLGKRNSMLFFSGVQIVSLLIMYLFPSNNMIFLIGMSAVFGFGMSGSSISYGIMCDAIDYGDWKFGIREEALASSLMSFGVKLSTALIGSVGVLLLAATGYVANAEQTAGAVAGINAIVNLIPAVITVIAMIPMFFYKLDNKTMEKIQGELAARKGDVA
ncbi:MAG: glycoside-pentoside-hexuronide (GPH):cation symporter [Hespellia sp.]|nr:glycoside-pentoside-hexuronide (GPH):cation symporter [Hespellia sp.]